MKMQQKLITLASALLVIFTFNSRAEFGVSIGAGISKVDSKIENQFNLKQGKVIGNGNNIMRTGEYSFLIDASNSSKESIVLGVEYLWNLTDDIKFGFVADALFIINEKKQKLDEYVTMTTHASSVGMVGVKLVKSFQKFDIYTGLGYADISRKISTEVTYGSNFIGALEVKNYSWMRSDGFWISLGSAYKISKKSSIFAEIRYIDTEQSTEKGSSDTGYINAEFKLKEKSSITSFLIGYRYYFK